MSFLRRLFGGGTGAPGTETPGPATTSASAVTAEPDEAARERELLHAEARRLDNDLIQRQLRYADRAWTPPAQGGMARAEDGDRPTPEG